MTYITNTSGVEGENGFGWLMPSTDSTRNGDWIFAIECTCQTGKQFHASGKCAGTHRGNYSGIKEFGIILGRKIFVE